MCDLIVCPGGRPHIPVRTSRLPPSCELPFPPPPMTLVSELLGVYENDQDEWCRAFTSSPRGGRRVEVSSFYSLPCAIEAPFTPSNGELCMYKAG